MPAGFKGVGVARGEKVQDKVCPWTKGVAIHATVRLRSPVRMFGGTVCPWKHSVRKLVETRRSTQRERGHYMARGDHCTVGWQHHVRQVEHGVATTTKAFVRRTALCTRGGRVRTREQAYVLCVAVTVVCRETQHSSAWKKGGALYARRKKVGRRVEAGAGGTPSRGKGVAGMMWGQQKGGALYAHV